MIATGALLGPATRRSGLWGRANRRSDRGSPACELPIERPAVWRGPVRDRAAFSLVRVEPWDGVARELTVVVKATLTSLAARRR